MDFLMDIWTVWNQQLGATVATILAVFALLKSTGKGVSQVVSAVRRWNGWTVLANLLKSVKTLYRVWRAKSVIRQSMEAQSLMIPVPVYHSCLHEDPSKSTRDQLEEITPAKPSWLNDYYVASALESLSNEGTASRAKRYDPNHWPPKPTRYDFKLVNADQPGCEEAIRLETIDHCAAYQSVQLCPRESRFELRASWETISPNRREMKSAYVLKDTAAPCELCWVKDERMQDIEKLVESITKYDLAAIATLEITGTNGELQDAVVTACVESQCPANPDPIKRVVEKAIDIRKENAGPDSSRPKHEWQQDEQQELVVTLKEYISSLKN